MALEKEDHTRDAQFNKALHGKSSQANGGIASMLSKDNAAQKAAVDEYFQHWDKKPAAEETEETRAARREQYATLTRQYVLLYLGDMLRSNMMQLLQSCHRSL
jgi:sterol 24-C-methyltransferase